MKARDPVVLVKEMRETRARRALVVSKARHETCRVAHERARLRWQCLREWRDRLAGRMQDSRQDPCDWLTLDAARQAVEGRLELARQALAAADGVLERARRNMQLAASRWQMSVVAAGLVRERVAGQRRAHAARRQESDEEEQVDDRSAASASHWTH